MLKLLISIALLGVYIDESIVPIDAQTAGVAKSPFTGTPLATSTYANNAGCYGPIFAVDGYSDYSGCNFFHSKATVPYPFLAATMTAASAQGMTSVTLKSRCDANGWGHTQFTVVVRAGTTPVIPGTPGNTGSSLLTANTLCGSYTGTVAQCSTVTIPCAAAVTALNPGPSILTVQLYTNGASNVHLMFEDVTVSTTAATTVTSSSVYYQQYGNFAAYWGPAFATDGAQSSTWYNLFHSAHESFPWLQIQLPAAVPITTVTLRSRCDANAWSCSVPNNINVEVRISATAIAATGFKGQLTNGQQCGTKIGCDASSCTTHTITCTGGPVASMQYISVQMLDSTNTFLMLDEVTWA